MSARYVRELHVSITGINAPEPSGEVNLSAERGDAPEHAGCIALARRPVAGRAS
jgi:hypothetical protein